MADLAYPSLIPIAFNTWLGPTLPEEHAAPALTAIPDKSKAITCVSEVRLEKAKHVVFGNLSESFPIMERLEKLASKLDSR